jgi:PPP family 3-phenylpropionic acid transporter
MLIGGLAAVVRWAAFAFTPPLWLLFPLQILHAASFCATFTGGLAMIERTAPRQSASAAQTLSSALSGGLLIGLATLASGPIFDRLGAFGYLAMCGMALAGLVGVFSMLRGLKPGRS